MARRLIVASERAQYIPGTALTNFVCGARRIDYRRCANAQRYREFHPRNTIPREKEREAEKERYQGD